MTNNERPESSVVEVILNETLGANEGDEEIDCIIANHESKKEAYSDNHFEFQSTLVKVLIVQIQEE